MRRRLLTMTMMGVALTGVVHAQAITQVGVREVAASERGVISLATKIRYTTMIILPDTEEILDVLCGDKEFWVINASHNIAHLKPAKEGAATNLNLVTASGTVYSFLLAEGKGAPGLALNIGTGNRYTLNQTLALLEKITGRPAQAKYAAPRAGDIRDSQADISLAKEALGYLPRFGFEEGLKRTWEWFCAAQNVSSRL